METDELLDLDEDLFDFDELLRDVELFAEESAPSAASDKPAAREPAPPSALPAEKASSEGSESKGLSSMGTPPPGAQPLSQPTHQPPRRPPPVAPRTQPARAPAQAGTPSAPEQVEVEPARRFVLGRGAALALGAVAAVNLALLVFVVLALGAVRGMVKEVGGQVASSSESVRDQAEDIARTFDQASRPVIAPQPEGAAALTRARALLARGEHQRARETLYALLAVADRLPANERRDVEARARFLIADTWRLEADAVEARAPAALQPQEATGPEQPAEEESQ